MTGSPTPTETVASFIAAVTSRQFDRVRELATEDVVFENVPMDRPVVAGREAVLALLERIYGGCTSIAYEVLTQAQVGSTVLTERIDRHVWDDGARADIRVMGRFDVVDGQVTLWRDYYDATQWHRNFDGDFVSYLQRRAELHERNS